MKTKCSLVICILSLACAFNTYSAIQQFPSDMSYVVSNTWYTDYEVDEFNDMSGSFFINCVTDGSFSNMVTRNEICKFLIALKKFSDDSKKFFAIRMIEYGALPTYDDSTTFYQASLKYNGEIQENQYMLLVLNKFVIIHEEQNSDLYHTLLYLLMSQTPFKLKLEKASFLGTKQDTTYICEMPATNFSEVYNAIYANVNN